MKSAKLTITCCDFHLIVSKMKERFEKYNDPYHLHEINQDTYVLYYESYSMRISSNLMVSVIMEKTKDDYVTFKVVSGGGKQGLFSIGWGAEQSRINLFSEFMAKLIKEHNWSIVPESTDDGIVKHVEQSLKLS